MRRLLRLCVQGFAALAALAAALFALDRAFPFPFERLLRPPARVVLAADGTPLRVLLPPDGSLRLPLAPGEVGPTLRRAIVAAEDRRFGRHPGVDPLALLRAAWSNLRAGRVVSGASTIPMQLARMAEPRPRTLRAKALESLRALQLVWHVEPETLLARYLDLAPFGGNLEGVGAAAFAWFGKRPDQLSLGEAALLAALPRAPSAHDPARQPAAARRARDRVLAQLARHAVFPAQALAEARRQPLPSRRRALPFLAPHFAELAAAREPAASRIASSLDLRAQQIAESAVQAHVAELRGRGIGDAAVVVVETGPRALRALVGSADYHAADRPGQVNGAAARRAPGSALKPWLYALAFDAGRLAPESFLLDVPTDFSGYVAENYDGRYRGRVSAGEALAQSLNAPAVRLLADFGLPRFLESLRAAGLASLDRPAAHYGLPLVLGAGEVTLLELTNLYATLADGGYHRPLRWQGGEPEAHGTRLLSPEAAAQTLRVLTTPVRPDLPDSWQLARDMPAVAWKTGTSYGHRDAWALGVSSRYAVGVWVGNLDGTPRRGMAGTRDAAPILFDVLRALDPRGGLPRPQRPLRLAAREVCAGSHELAGPYCPLRSRIEVIRGATRLRPCSLHRRVFLDEATGLRLAGACLGARAHRAAVLEVFPAELVAWWRAIGHDARGALPALHPACGAVPGGEAPVIVSPDAATPYRLRRDAPPEFQKLRLAARVAAGAQRLHWYQDGQLLASAAPAETLFAALAPGPHRLVVVDDAGRSDALEYRVE